MPMGPPARDLRDRITVQRRTSVTSPGGGTKGDWATLITSRACKLNALTPRRGNSEEVIALRLQGTSLWDGWVRFDSETSQIQTSDRIVDARDATRVFNVRFAEDLEGRRLWIFMQLEQGVAEG